jgi:hypothetical protein
MSIASLPSNKILANEVIIDAGPYLEYANSALTLNLNEVGTTGQALVKNADGVSLDWVTIGSAGGVVNSLTGGSNIQISGTAEIPVVSMPILGTYVTGRLVGQMDGDLRWVNPTSLTGGSNIQISGTTETPVVSMAIAGSYVSGQLVGQVDGDLTWVNPPSPGGGVVTSITAGENISVDSTDPAVPIVSLPIAGTYAVGSAIGQSGGALSWFNPAGTSFTLIETGNVDLYVSPINSGNLLSAGIPFNMYQMGNTFYISFALAQVGFSLSRSWSPDANFYLSGFTQLPILGTSNIPFNFSNFGTIMNTTTGIVLTPALIECVPGGNSTTQRLRILTFGQIANSVDSAIMTLSSFFLCFTSL